MKALILNGRVVDISGVEFAVHPSMQWVDCPEGVQVGYLYDDGVFTAPIDINIQQGIANYRTLLEQTVITYGDHSSYCDKESETGLSECINNILDNGGEKTISWQGPNGYTVAGLEGLSGLRKNVVDFRQKTRDAERLTLADHAGTPFESVEAAIAAFDAYMEE